jgi:hypothetical protein
VSESDTDFKNKKGKTFMPYYGILFPLPFPIPGGRREVYQVTIYSFLFSVLAGIVSGIIVEIMLVLLRKWFDRKRK